MTQHRFVYEMVGGEYDGEFLVLSQEVREYRVPIVQPYLAIASDMGLAVSPGYSRYVVTRHAVRFTVAPEIAASPDCAAWLIAESKQQGAYGEMRMSK